MALPITFNNTVYQAGFFGTDDGGVPTNATRSFRIDDTYSFPVTVNGTVTDGNSTVTLTYTYPGDAGPTTQTLNATSLDNPSMILFTGRGLPGNQDGSLNRYVFSNVQMYGNPPPAGQTRTTFADDGNGTAGDYVAPVCFVTGTLIGTSRGDVAVEDLAVGDLAITASGEHRPIRWIGSRTIDPRRDPRPEEAMPVRIRAGALGRDRPRRDLVVSPGHSICLDVLGDVLVLASALVNGSTVVQEDVDSVTYWHVELDSHDILIAEGQPVESYLDMGNRGFFARSSDGATVIDLAAGPDADPAARTHADFCRPFHDGGAVVACIREHVQAEAAAQGWHLSDTDPWVGVHLIADGVRVEPEVSGSAARFSAPAGARDLWLCAPTSIPSRIGLNADRRRLGLRVSELRVGDAWDAPAVALDDPLLCIGFHPVESDGSALRRWTADRARLPDALWPTDDRTLVLRLDPKMAALPHWVGPVDVAYDALQDEQHRSAA